MDNKPQVTVDVAGLTDQEDADALKEQLQDQKGVSVQRAEQARVVLTYDPDVIDATELQGLIEAAGAEVITMNPE